MNHEGFDRRLELASNVLTRYGLEALEITPVEYDENGPFPYNNFIYKITLSEPATKAHLSGKDAYTVSPPSDGAKIVVLRMSNQKGMGLNNANRVESEVAAIHLARRGLEAFQPALVDVMPAIYAWQPAKEAADGMGWILMDFKPGVALDAKFASLSKEDQQSVINQTADIFRGVQGAPLPGGVNMFGGLTIDSARNIVTGQMSTLKGGPWSSYADFWRTRLADQLRESEESSALLGWKANGVRDRIDAFLAGGIDEVLGTAKVDTTKLALIHGDFTMNNMLFDEDTKTVTGLVDFDFASISHPCQEYFSSFADVGGNLSAGHGPDLTAGHRIRALLSGNFDTDGVPDEGLEKFNVAKAWDRALTARKVTKPSDIIGVSALYQLSQLEGLLCPFRLWHPRFLSRKTPEEIAEERKLAEQALVKCLDDIQGH